MTFIKQILVPTDFSYNSSAAINYACELAKESKSRLHLLHVVNGKLDTENDQVDHLERIGALLDERSELSIDTVKRVKSGKPDRVIPEYARDQDIDILVMGTHGRTGLAHLALGSVTESVLRSAPCPVLVLGPHDAEDVSIKRAAQLLEEKIGDGLVGDQESGRTGMLRMLVQELRIPAITSIALLKQLEKRGWLLWDNGKWTVIQGAGLIEDSESLGVLTTDSQAVDLILRGRRLNASDIHIDPVSSDESIVRIRVDGRLQEYCRVHRSVANHLVNQLKTLAGLDIADPFHIKEGSLRLPSRLSKLEVRLTSVPVAGGQAVSLRLFDPELIFLPLDQLGLSATALKSVNQILRQSEGLVLVTGPTGSGKTTSVYSMLETFGGKHRNIVSIEDPVEYAVPFVRQMNVDARHGVTMTEGLRAILRMDPDVVFIGEIRDPETAAIGMRSASSGKYVFSTLHTRDVASTITALRDMNLDDRSLASNLSGIINQRLVRRLCQECKQACDITPEQKEHFELAGLDIPRVLFRPGGCPVCFGKGFRGQTGVFEVAKVGNELVAAIHSAKSERKIEKLLRSLGAASLQTDALMKAASGLTSFDSAMGIRWLG